MTLPAPMNVQSHVLISKKIPILATSIAPVTYWFRDVNEPQTKRHNEENVMMIERWRQFTLLYQIPQAGKRNPPPCEMCFRKYVL